MEGLEGSRRRRVVRFLALAACGALCAGAVSCGDESSVEVRPVRTDDPAVAFAPLVHLHSREEFFPMSTERFLDHSTLEWSGGPCPYEVNLAAGPASQRTTGEGAPRLTPKRLGNAPTYRYRPQREDCRRRRPVTFSSTQRVRPYDDGRRPAGLAPDEGMNLDFLLKAYGGEQKLERRGEQRFLHDVPTYFTSAPTEVAGKPGLRLSYWLLFGYAALGGPTGEEVTGREGQWQRVDVLVQRAPGSSRYLPVAARYHWRDGYQRIPWEELELVPEGTGSHPVVYSALRSHGAYPSAGSHRRSVRPSYSPDRAIATVERTSACADCPQWRTWELLRDATKEPWYGFGGGWGVRGEDSGDSGPLGPSPFNR